MLGGKQRWLMAFSSFSVLIAAVTPNASPSQPYPAPSQPQFNSRGASFACGHFGLIHLEGPATMPVRTHLGRKEFQTLCLNDWQSPCDHSHTSWYPECFSVLPLAGVHPVCLYLLFSTFTGTEQRVVKTLFLFTLLPYANHCSFLHGICSQKICSRRIGVIFTR